jgi:hypothetical protein
MLSLCIPAEIVKNLYILEVDIERINKGVVILGQQGHAH